MKQSALPSYTKICQILKDTAFTQHLAQIHGMMCGMLCGRPLHSIAWEELINEKIAAPAKKILHALYEQSARQLNEFLFEFELLLPPDTKKLSERAEALTLWCQGFLMGLKFAHIPIEHREANETTEAIDDLIEIAKMNYEQVVASEEDEAAYAELVEYIRMAVILIYQEHQEGGNSSHLMQMTHTHH